MGGSQSHNVTREEHAVVIDHYRGLVAMLDMHSDSIEVISVLLKGIPVGSVLHHCIDWKNNLVFPDIYWDLQLKPLSNPEFPSEKALAVGIGIIAEYLIGKFNEER
jgi:hypothetical protein